MLAVKKGPQAICQFCKADFVKTHGSMKYCSKKCLMKAWNATRSTRETIKKKRMLVLDTCEHCKTEYQRRQDIPFQRFCCRKCATAARWGK